MGRVIKGGWWAAVEGFGGPGSRMVDLMPIRSHAVLTLTSSGFKAQRPQEGSPRLRSLFLPSQGPGWAERKCKLHFHLN